MPDKFMRLRCPDMPHADGVEGRITAVISELGKPDKYDDIILPGAVGEQRAMVGGWGHALLKTGQPPLGVGRVWEDGERLLADIELDMELSAAVQMWRAIDRMRDLVEWSFGYRTLDAGPQVIDGIRRWVYRSLELYEISPCAKGVSNNTGTVDMRSAADGGNESLYVPTAAELEAAAWTAAHLRRRAA